MELVKKEILVYVLIALFIVGCKMNTDNGLSIAIHYDRIKNCERNCDEVVITIRNKTNQDILLFQGEVSLEPSLYEYKIENDVLVDSSQIPSWSLQLPPDKPPLWLNKSLATPDAFLKKHIYPETNQFLKSLVKKFEEKNIKNDVYKEDLLIFFNESIFLKKDSTWNKTYRNNFNLHRNDSSVFKIKVSYFNEDYGLNIVQDQINFIMDSLKTDLPEQLDGYYIWKDKISAELEIHPK